MNIWSRLGLSVALAAGFCILLMECFQHTRYYQAARWYACILFAASGVGLSVVGLLRRKRADPFIPSQSDGKDPDQTSSRVASRLPFWGPVLVVFGLIVLALPFRESDRTALEKISARAPLRPQTSAPAAMVSVTGFPPVGLTSTTAFPQIKIQGLVYRPPTNNAIIVKGHSYFVGDRIENARIFSIFPSAVVLEIDGHYQTVPIEPTLQPRL